MASLLNSKWKIATILVAFYQTVFTLEAPYLISATALSDSSVTLAWRNNDVATQGFIIERTASIDQLFTSIDSVKSATQSSYIDIKNLKPRTEYTYRLSAYNAAEVSDASNSLNATTLEATEIFIKPSIAAYWNFDTSKSVRIIISDSSTVEQGYRLYRAEGNSSSFSLLGQITSTDPASRGSITVNDTAIKCNQWYTYQAVACSGSDSVASDPCLTYTFRAPRQEQVVKFEKLSDFPLNMAGWSAKAGDSILLKENPSSDGKFTAVNIKDPAHPKFDGYIDSAALLSYPQNTLIPAFLMYGVSNSYARNKISYRKDLLIILTDSILTLYKMNNDTTVKIDSLTVRGSFGQTFLVLNDSLLVVHYHSKTDLLTRPNEYFYFLPVFFSSSGFSALPPYEEGSIPYRPSSSFLCRSFLQGYADGTIAVSVDGMRSGLGLTDSLWHDLIIYDVSLHRAVTLNGLLPFANAYNTGYRIFPEAHLCTNAFGGNYASDGPYAIPLEVFSSDILNPHGRYADSINNVIYRDTVHKQNTLQNILVDTANQRVFLLFSDNLSILRYERVQAGAKSRNARAFSAPRGIIMMANGPSGVTLIIPSRGHVADLFFYDLSGRCVERILKMQSNTIRWKPKNKTMNCYIVKVRSGGDQFISKVLIK